MAGTNKLNSSITILSIFYFQKAIDHRRLSPKFPILRSFPMNWFENNPLSGAQNSSVVPKITVKASLKFLGGFYIYFIYLKMN
jgi:hypothetical protein